VAPVLEILPVRRLGLALGGVTRLDLEIVEMVGNLFIAGGLLEAYVLEGGTVTPVI
jgi:hypothetical protein